MKRLKELHPSEFLGLYRHIRNSVERNTELKISYTPSLKFDLERNLQIAFRKEINK